MNPALLHLITKVWRWHHKVKLLKSSVVGVKTLLLWLLMDVAKCKLTQQEEKSVVFYFCMVALKSPQIKNLLVKSNPLKGSRVQSARDCEVKKDWADAEEILHRKHCEVPLLWSFDDETTGSKQMENVSSVVCHFWGKSQHHITEKSARKFVWDGNLWKSPPPFFFSLWSHYLLRWKKEELCNSLIKPDVVTSSPSNERASLSFDFMLCY